MIRIRILVLMMLLKPFAMTAATSAVALTGLAGGVYFARASLNSTSSVGRFSNAIAGGVLWGVAGIALGRSEFLASKLKFSQCGNAATFRLIQAIEAGDDVDKVKKCLQDGALINGTQYYQPLGVAVKFERLETVRFLLQQGAKNITDILPEHPENKIEIIKLLMAYGYWGPAFFAVMQRKGLQKGWLGWVVKLSDIELFNKLAVPFLLDPEIIEYAGSVATLVGYQLDTALRNSQGLRSRVRIKKQIDENKAIKALLPHLRQQAQDNNARAYDAQLAQQLPPDELTRLRLIQAFERAAENRVSYLQELIAHGQSQAQEAAPLLGVCRI